MTKRRFLQGLFLIFFMVTLLTMLFACEETTEPLTEVAIDSMESFSNLPENIDKNTTFVIKNDLSSTDFAPLSLEKDSAFQGIIDGQNKTVELTIKDKNLSIFAMFGYAKNLTVKDLTLKFVVDDSCKLATHKTVIASLVANAIDNVTIDNVNVEFSVSPQMTLKEYYIDDEPDPRYSSENSVYFGGMVGIAGGKTTIQNSKINLTINQEDKEYNSFNGKNMYRKEIFAGGVVSTSSVASNLEIKNVEVENFAFTGKSEDVFLGGIIALSKDALITDSNVTSYSFSIGFSNKLTVGGAVGEGYKTTLKNLSLTGNIDLDALENDSDKTYISLGGIGGYFYAPLSPTYQNDSIAENITSSITADASYVVTADARFSYGFGIIENASFSDSTLLGTLTNVIKDDDRLMSQVGDSFGEARGSAVVKNITDQASEKYSSSIVTEMRQNEGETQKTYLPRIS